MMNLPADGPASAPVPETDGEIEGLERHADQIALLTNMVALSRLGGIATVECDNIELRKKLFGVLAEELLKKDVYLYPVEVSNTDLNLIRFLRDLTDKSGFKDLELVGRYKNIALFVYGIEKYTEEQQETFLQFLNLFRDAATIIKQPVVIWATRHFIAKIAREAPDFWAWKGMTFQFESEGAGSARDERLPGFQHYAHALSDDPDFAIWRDLYVPVRASLLQPQPDSSRERHEVARREWQEAFLPGSRWTPENSEESRWVRRKTANLLGLLRIRGGERVVVLGDAGAGKTTFLRYLTYRYASLAFRQFAGEEPGRLVPIFIKLNRLREYLSIEQLLLDAFNQYELPDAVDPATLYGILTGSVEQMPSGDPSPAFLLLFDGLNEISQDHQNALYAFLARLSRRHAVVLTCRLENYLPIEGFNLVLLEPLDEQDIQRYAVVYLGERAGRRLTADLMNSRELLELARNPLSLFMLTQYSATTDDSLPQNRGRLLQQFTDALLKRTETEWWRLFGRSKSKVTLEVSKRVLAQLGFVMQQEGLVSISIERCYWMIKEIAFETSVNASVRDIFEGLLFSALIRLGDDRESIEFLHQSVRDYFAALHLLEAGENMWDEFEQADGEWQGTTVLLFGISPDRPRLYHKIVGDGSDERRLWLAARCLAAVRTEEGAWEELRASLEDRRSLAIFHVICGLVYETLGDFHEAMREFREAMNADGAYSRTYYELGVMYRQMGQPQHAISAFREVIALEPTFADAYNQLGIAYYEAGDADRALLVFSTARELDPENPHHHYNTGLLLNELQRHEQAREAFERAVELQPEYEEARGEPDLIQDEEIGTLVDLLTAFPPFGEWPSESRATIARRMRLRCFKTGQAVILQGDVGTEFYLIQKGEAVVTTRDCSGQPITLRRIGPGDGFGEDIFDANRARRTVTVRAITPLRVWALHREDFEQVQNRHRELARVLVQTRYERMQHDVKTALEASVEPARAPSEALVEQVGMRGARNASTVSVLVADVGEPLPLANKSEQAKESLFFQQLYLDFIRAGSHDGLMWQVANGRILATFDRPLSAVRAALALHQTFTRLVARWTGETTNSPIRGLGIGVSTGQATRTRDEVGLETASAGTPLLVATRLSAHGRSTGDILIDEGTYRAIGETAEAVHLPAETLSQGFDHPLQVFRVSAGAA